MSVATTVAQECPRRFLTIHQLAERWGGVSQSLIHREIASGRLAKTKIGRLARFNLDDVIRYEESRRVQAGN